MVNAARCSGIASLSERPEPAIISTTSEQEQHEERHEPIGDRSASEAERALNATTNVRRYSASGAIQKSGTGAMSVEKYVVTASIRLDGMNASTTQVARRSHVRLVATHSAPLRAGNASPGPTDRAGEPASGALHRHPAATDRHAARTNTP